MFLWRSFPPSANTIQNLTIFPTLKNPGNIFFSPSIFFFKLSKFKFFSKKNLSNTDLTFPVNTISASDIFATVVDGYFYPILSILNCWRTILSVLFIVLLNMLRGKKKKKKKKKQTNTARPFDLGGYAGIKCSTA